MELRSTMADNGTWNAVVGVAGQINEVFKTKTVSVHSNVYVVQLLTEYGQICNYCWTFIFFRGTTLFGIQRITEAQHHSSFLQFVGGSTFKRWLAQRQIRILWVWFVSGRMRLENPGSGKE